MPSLHSLLSRFRGDEWCRAICDHLDSMLSPVVAVASTPARALNSAFQPHATKTTLVSYSVQITCTATISGSQNGKVELMCDAVNPPTTVRATAQNRAAVSLAIVLQSINEHTCVLNCVVPAGHYVRLVTTQTMGTPTFALVAQTEVVIN